jgi:hypothetical protein
VPFYKNPRVSSRGSEILYLQWKLKVSKPYPMYAGAICLLTNNVATANVCVNV